MGNVFAVIWIIPCAPNIVAFTVDKIFNWVPIVGIRSHTCSKFYEREKKTKKQMVRKMRSKNGELSERR